MTIASISLHNDLQRLEVISHNLANSLTPGYKRQVLIGASFEAQMAMQTSRASLDLANPITHDSSISIDPSAGVLRYTGNMQEIAAEGDAFFELVGKDGPLYTKQGDLRVDLQGRLINANGLAVMGTGGEIRLNNTAFSIAANGDVSQDGRVAGRIKLVQFENPANLQAIGSGNYAQGNARFAPIPAQTASSIRVGFQENSNVNSAHEMVRLTESVRHFEAMAKIVQGYDESLEKAIRKLGEF